MLKENEIIQHDKPMPLIVDRDTGRYVRQPTPEELEADAKAKTEAKVEKPKRFKIEIAVCETISGSGQMSHGKVPGKGSATYHVEVRFVPSPGAHSICFQGWKYSERAKAEADKTFVESVLKRSVMQKPKPVKERTRTKARRRSRKS